jgi:hypothetical protein
VRQDVTRLVSDIREAQRLGPQYAALMDKLTEMEQVIKVALMPLKETVLEHLPKILDWMLTFGIWATETFDSALIFDYGLQEIVAEMKKAREDARRGAGGEFNTVMSATYTITVVETIHDVTTTSPEVLDKIARLSRNGGRLKYKRRVRRHRP